MALRRRVRVRVRVCACVSVSVSVRVCCVCVRACICVCVCVPRTPGAAKDDPFVDQELLPKHFDVGDEVLRGVVHQARVGRRLSGPALVDEDDTCTGFNATRQNVPSSQSCCVAC